MGINNLLPLLEKSTRRCHVSEFRGLTVAVDSYCWLHKGARSCAMQLVKGEDTDMYVQYCMKYVQMLLSYDIKPIMVFDGCRLPAKLPTEEKRSNQKKIIRKEAMELLRLGKVDEACKGFNQCVDVTPEMALKLIKACRNIQVDCIVAPYEADAQLAFFSLKGIAQCIISEDSDLLVFGCQKVLYKMDLNGVGQLVEADKIHLSLKIRPDQYTFDKFRYICILNGCDYVESLPGIGLKKAIKFITMTAEENPEIFLDKIPRYLNLRYIQITQEYKQNFLTADATFKHQIVYDPFNRKLMPLNPIQTKVIYCKNAGSYFEPEIAFQLALGNVNPNSMQIIDKWVPSLLPDFSIWSLNYTPRPLKTVTNVSTEPKYSKTRVLSPEEINRINIEQEEKWNKELEFYKKKIPLKTESPAETSSLETTETSPVLTNSKNPFIKKKISKFGTTAIDSEQRVVASRFFAVPNLEVCKEDSETGNDEIVDQKLAIVVPPAEHMDVEIPNGLEVSDTELLNNVSDTEISTNIQTVSDDGVLSQAENLSLYSENSELSETSFSSDDPLFIECECILEVEDRVLDVFSDTPQLTSLENLTVEPISKRMKLEPKKVNKPKRQMTITAMFKKMTR